MLGTRAVRRWATVVALSTRSPAPRTSSSRSRSCAPACASCSAASAGEEERDRLFTVGLLSVADALLDAPMDEVLASLPLSEEIKGALLRFEGRRGRVLATVLRYEQGHFPAGADGDPGELAEAYLDRAALGGRRRALARLELVNCTCRCASSSTLAFTGVMAVLLDRRGDRARAAVAANLDSTIDDGLAARAGDAAAVVRGRGGCSRAPASRSRRCSAPDGEVLDTTTGAGPRPLLAPGRARARRAHGDVIVERRRATASDLRLLARPGASHGPPAVLVVGESLAQRERALDGLHALLLIGGPLALLIASAIGYALAAAALRPVERMRRHAAAVTAAETSERLPVPPSNDEIGRLGHTLNEMLARLRGRRSSASGRSCRDAWHELRTPLAILRTELELALRGEHTREELEAAVRSAAEEAERLSQLAEDLLVIARSDQGRLPVRPRAARRGRRCSRASPAASARARKAEGRPLAPDRRRACELDADPARIEQALANIVDNALRHGRGTVVLQRRARSTAASSCTCATRARLPARVPAARLRALLPRRRGALARRHRAGSRDRRRDRRRARRQRPRRQQRERAPTSGSRCPHEALLMRGFSSSHLRLHRRAGRLLINFKV